MKVISLNCGITCSVELNSSDVSIIESSSKYGCVQFPIVQQWKSTVRNLEAIEVVLQEKDLTTLKNILEFPCSSSEGPDEWMNRKNLYWKIRAILLEISELYIEMNAFAESLYSQPTTVTELGVAVKPKGL